MYSDPSCYPTRFLKWTIWLYYDTVRGFICCSNRFCGRFFRRGKIMLYKFASRSPMRSTIQIMNVAIIGAHICYTSDLTLTACDYVTITLQLLLERKNNLVYKHPTATSYSRQLDNAGIFLGDRIASSIMRIIPATFTSHSCDHFFQNIYTGSIQLHWHNWLRVNPSRGTRAEGPLRKASEQNSYRGKQHQEICYGINGSEREK